MSHQVILNLGSKLILESFDCSLLYRPTPSHLTPYPYPTDSKKEYQEWAAIRDRTSKRFWERVKHPRSYEGKLSDKEQKEEKEYLEAFEEERRLKSQIEALEGEVGNYEDEVSVGKRQRCESFSNPAS